LPQPAPPPALAEAKEEPASGQQPDKPRGAPSLLPLGPAAGATASPKTGQGAAPTPPSGEELPKPDSPGLTDPLARLLAKDKKPTPAPTRPVVGNREWVIGVECKAGAAVLMATGLEVPLDSLRPAADGSNPLAQALTRLIARRQASVRPGEPPFRPQLRFFVRPEGLRSYYRAFPALEALGLPMTRENVESVSEAKP
jgi:hypothetical protein